MQRNNDYLETQHKQDLYHAKSLKDQLHQLQYDNNLLYDEIERQKRELLFDNDKLIKENKTLIVERDNLRKQRDELAKKLNGEANYAYKSKPFLGDEQTKNNYLKTKTPYVVGHTNCERRVTFYKNKATLVDKQCQNLLEENSQLKNQAAELRKERNAIQTRYEKRFSRDVPVTFTNRGKNGSTHSPKLTGKGRPPKQNEKTTTSEDDDSTIQFLPKECGEWKLKNEHLNTRIEDLKYTVSNNERANSKLKNEIELIQSEFELYQNSTQRELQALHDTIKIQQKRIELLDDELKSQISMSVKKDKFEEIVEKLRVLNENLEYEMSQNDMLSKERNKYKEQVEHMVDYHALLRREDQKSKYLQITTEKNQQLERQLFSLKKSEQVLAEKIDSRNNEIKEFRNDLECKDRYISKLLIKLQRQYQEFDERVSEDAVIKKTNVIYERLVSDLQTEINQYKRNLACKSLDSSKLTNTVSKLKYEVENYRKELEKARVEIQNAEKNRQHVERICSDIKKSEEACLVTVNYLKEKVRGLTKRKDGDINNLKFECQRKCKELENAKTELSLIKELNKTNEQLVTDLQIELGQYKRNLKDKDFYSETMSNTIRNLRLEVETYQSEINQTRDELRNATEKTKQAFIDERGSLNDKVRELTNMLKRKDSDMRMMEKKMAEISSTEEKNIKLERQVTDLQSEVNQYTSDLKENSSASAKLTNTISNLRREAETYQSELNQARDEIRNATEKIQQMQRKFSDKKMSDQALIDETDFLNDKLQELTNILKRKESDVLKMEEKMAEYSLMEKNNIKLKRQVTDLQSEVNQYRSDLNENSSASTKLTNTITNLRREAETYQSELNQARDELRNATEKIQQIERQFSDTKKTDQKLIDETVFLNDKILNLTNILKRKESDVRKMETKMAECSSIEEKNNKLERQVTDLQTEVKRYESDLKDKSSASAKLTNTISNLRREAKTYESELNQAHDELRNATEKIQLIERQISDLKRSEQALIDERDSLNDNIRELNNILKGKDSDIQKIETKLTEYSLIKEENAIAERQITDLQIEIKQYKNELKDKSDNLTKQTNTFSNLSHESERCKSELKDAHEKIRKLNLQLKTVNDEHEKCNHLISSLRKENAKQSMYKDNDQTRRSEATLNQKEHELSLALEKSQRELREVKHELDDTKTRLSKVMGQKLTDNNPNIADLSDKNRPTKLAERYSELYDNQWTDAFEVICKQLHDEKSTIESLIDILMNAAKYCREEAMTQLETIQGILLPRKTGSTFPSLVHKNLKDCRKALGEQTGAAIYEKYLRDIAKQCQQSLQLDVKPYVKECVELCWLMSIQDPPVVVAPELQHGANFDTDFYKAYTKSGPLIDYVVWPALCLHEKGPLLCKGIAQGYGGKKTKY